MNSSPILAELSEILLGSKALQFGEFITKAGRNSPYFIDFGKIYRADWLKRLGNLYQQSLRKSQLDCTEVIFGPAYKGIILALAAVMSADQNQGALSFAFNRKEAKAHGEGGNIVGHPMPKGTKTIIIDDVLSRGTSATESIKLLKPKGINIQALMIAVDREECGYYNESARNEIETVQGVPVISMTTISELGEFLCQHDILGQRWLKEDELQKINAYQLQTFIN